MGFGEMLGVKSVKVKFKDSYTPRELFAKMSGVDFGQAGEPGIYEIAGNDIIAFPQIDVQNQVWVTGAGRDKKSDTFTVMRSVTIAGDSGMLEAVGNFGLAEGLDKLTGGLFGLHSVLGSPKKKCMADVDIVVEKLNGLGL